MMKALRLYYHFDMDGGPGHGLPQVGRPECQVFSPGG